MAKHIFITGGVVSSLGKGITAASIGQLLKSRGFKVSMQKFDPYLNVDPGTLSPYQHGEVFVTDDGAETDLDLGHYERFIDESLNKYASVSSGKIYLEVMEKERKGEYGGKTVQVIPHITNAIKDKLKKVAELSNADIVITEIGGTVGDIESLPFLEAIRQARREIGYENTMYIHNTLVPYLKAANEIKTKPTQHSVKELMSLGIHPDMIVLRSDVPISDSVKEKIALFCDVNKKNIFEVRDVDVLYEVIVNLKNQNIDDYILDHFKINNNVKAEISEWKELISKIKEINKSVKVGLVGKYTEMKDSYLSVVESLNHAGYYHGYDVEIEWIDSDSLDGNNIDDKLKDCKGIIVPGGFGTRGIKGKIEAIKYAREKDIPTLGIGYGMQLIVVEHFQNVLKIKDAHTIEFNSKTTNPLFIFNDNQNGNEFESKIRLGLHDIEINKNSTFYNIYNKEIIKERHRNRYEFNNSYLDDLNNSDILIAATSVKEKFIEAIEYKNKKWIKGVIYHPEFLSRPLRAHPLFIDFVKNVIE